MNVKNIGLQLPAAIFSRVSKSYIVNVHQITSFDHELIYIQNHEIPLGQNFKESFMDQFVNGKIVKR